MIDQAENQKKVFSTKSAYRRDAANSLSQYFPLVNNKDQAWKDLIELSKYENSRIRYKAANSFGSAFPLVPDKDHAWMDLHRLTQDKDCKMRQKAACSLDLAFPFNPDRSGLDGPTQADTG